MTDTLTDGMKLQTAITFETIVCYKCGTPFAVPQRFRKQLLDTHQTFYCPNGHPQSYCGKTDAEKLKEQLEAEKKKFELEKERLTNRLLDEMNLAGELATQKNKLEKQLKRVHNGVCPCCRRSFQNLQNHMNKQHPEFNKELDKR